MTVTVEVRTYDDPDVVRLVAEVQAEYVLRYGGVDEATVDAGEFDPPNGCFLVGLLDGEAVATGGIRRIAPGTAEIKRMYVAAPARRRGIARIVLAELERRAGEAGLDRLVLNTGNKQPEAIALYKSSGYLPATAFGHYACTPGALFYTKQLTAEQLTATQLTD